MTRKQAREAALHALYALTFHGGIAEADVPDMLSDESLAAWRDECSIYKKPPGAEAEYLQTVTLGVWLQSAALERRIAAAAQKWKTERISRVALTLMKLALFEPTAVDGVTQAVAINEAVELCKRYDSPESAAFINGILGTLAREGEGTAT